MSLICLFLFLLLCDLGAFVSAGFSLFESRQQENAWTAGVCRGHVLWVEKSCSASSYRRTESSLLNVSPDVNAASATLNLFSCFRQSRGNVNSPLMVQISTDKLDVASMSFNEKLDLDSLTLLIQNDGD